MRANAQASGGTRNNIQLMESDEAQVIFADGLHYDAYNGRDSYEGQPKTFLRAMAPLYPEAIHIVAHKDSGIKTLADLAGQARLCRSGRRQRRAYGGESFQVRRYRPREHKEGIPRTQRIRRGLPG